ncbi:MAG: hypothetical protein GX574_09940 [Lentisphaerae bacterium]|nr:hypothetical protein [Lentisphaerota bacterium]
MFFKVMLSVLILSAGTILAETLRLPPEPAKKIIQFGWDNPTPDFLEKNIDLVEAHLPYDGIGIRMLGGTYDLDGAKFSTEGAMFGRTKFKAEWFEPHRQSLRNTKFKKLTHNFLRTSGPSFHGREFDLFDDAYWEASCHNFALFAFIAKDTGAKGLNFDLEDYGNNGIWQYRPGCGRAWPQAYDQARARGRQFITAITNEYPDITLFVFFWLDLAFGAADGMPLAFERLEGFRSGLLVGFINGIYDALPPSALIVDGMEAHGYSVRNIDSLYRLRAQRETRFRRLVAPENQRKLREQTALAVATYLDSYINQKPPYCFQADMANENMTAIEFFRRNLRLAVEFSDQYAWTWNEQRLWYPSTLPFGWQRKALDKNPEVPGPLWGQALPGIEDAINYARAPHDYALQQFASGRCSGNLLLNSSFEAETKQAAVLDLAPDSVVLDKIPNWETWQPKHSKGSFRLAANEGYDGRHAMQAVATNGGVIHQVVKINPNSVYVVRALAKTQAGAGATCGIAWRNQKGVWCNQLRNFAVPFSEDLDKGWRRATIVVHDIPENTAFLSVMLGMNSAGAPDQAVWFDEVEIHEILFKSETQHPQED